MASWQYKNPSDKAPLVPTNQGYYTTLPYSKHSEPNDKRYTALLEFNNNQLYLWVHDISMSFQLGGATAQSHHYRTFYARNLTQPSVTITGQTHSQEQYAEIAEFIRAAQSFALKPQDINGLGNTMSLTIPSGGTLTNTKNLPRGRVNKTTIGARSITSTDTHHAHEGHHFRGHIKNIQRKADRWINAPEFTFEFIVVTAYQGVFSAYFDDPSVTKARLAMYMQIPDQATRNVTWVVDPDSTYNKGAVPG